MKRINDDVKERWITLIGIGIVLGIVFGILIDIQRQNNILIYKAEAKELEVIATTTPKVVMIQIEYDKAGIEKLIRATFPEAPNTAVAIAKAESGLNAKAYNPEAHKGCNGSIGVFQIACVHVGNKESLKDVEINIKKAREIYLKEGWKPWGAYTNGSYKSKL